MVLRCPKCIRSAIVGAGLTWEEELNARQRIAAQGIVATGREGKRQGRYNRPTREVKHTTCGHVWMTTHPDAQRRPLETRVVRS
jgi:hypothetical protein